MSAIHRALFPAALLALVAGTGADALAGHMGDGGGSHADINIIVREVRVTPVRAHVGDVISVEMVVEDHGDPYYANVPAEILANGKVVARKLVTYGLGGEGGRIKRVALKWDTRGAKPGEYRIEGQVFVWRDSSEFDNSLKVAEPVVLVAPGAPFPNARQGGGTAVAMDPRYKPAPPAASDSPPPPETGGY